MKRLRRGVTVDKDAVSPDALGAAMEYLLRAIEEMAVTLAIKIGRDVVVDWNTYHVYTRVNRRGDHRIIARARVIA